MRLTEILYDNETFPRLVVWSEKLCGWLDVSELVGSNPESTSLESSLRFPQSNFSLDAIRSRLLAYEDACAEDDSRVRLTIGDLKYQPLFPLPSKILCVGLNYADHAKEFGDALPTEPVIFNKAPSSVSFCGADILLPKVSQRVDYEGELVVVIGKTAKNVAENDALKYVAGYTCGNDVSARDWQKEKPAGQWFLGKSFDSFAPVGPCFVTADEVGDPNALKIQTRLNGVVMQSSNTSCFIFKVQRLISYLSQVMTLQPGDLLFTGTPDGVGDARKPPVYLGDGDKFEVEIEKIGVLTNYSRRLS